jgi:hypothetical protein
MSDLTAQQAAQIAAARWFNKEEVFDLLHNFESIGLAVTETVPVNPPSKRRHQSLSLPLRALKIVAPLTLSQAARSSSTTRT